MDETVYPPDPTGATEPPKCKYCHEPMARMAIPALAAFDSPWMYVCFNDDCGYFVRGWDRMEQQTGQRTSYRFKTDPFTGETGPLPVWSPEALRDSLLPDEGEDA